MPSYSRFASQLQAETAFTVLALAKQVKASGKDVIELEIGDSPFPTTASARSAGFKAIEEGQTHYCPSAGLPEMRSAAAEIMQRDYGVPCQPANVVVGPGAKAGG